MSREQPRPAAVQLTAGSFQNEIMNNRVTVTLSPLASQVLEGLSEQNDRSKDKEAARILNPALESLATAKKKRGITRRKGSRI